MISLFSVVQQNISVETMRVSWDQSAQNAIAYEAQWRRNDGNWVNVPRSSTTSFDVPAFMPGATCACAINAAGNFRLGLIPKKTLTGKVGKSTETRRICDNADQPGDSPNPGSPGEYRGHTENGNSVHREQDFKPLCCRMFLIRPPNTPNWD